jgi:hypothetical protein
MARSSSSRSPSPSIGMNKIRLKLSNLMLKLTNPLLSLSFATGASDSPPGLINTRPVSEGLHYKGCEMTEVRANDGM